MKNIFILILFMSYVLTYAQDNEDTWKSARGPLGSNATAFYIDEQGTYWLGTGPNGGVYSSQDQGSSWQEANQGLEPRHITWLGKKDKTLYAEVSLASTGTNDFAFYQWLESEHAWDVVEKDAEVQALREFAQQEIAKRKAILEPKEQLRIYPEEESSANARIHGFKNSIANFQELNQSFPKDAYLLRGGNFYEFNGQRFLLSRSGAYKLHEEVGFIQLGEIGLSAAVVTHLSSSPTQQGVYAIVNRQDVALLDGQGSWNTLYELNDYPLEGGLFTDHPQRININSEGRKLLCLQGNIWEITDRPSMMRLQAPISLEEISYSQLDENPLLPKELRSFGNAQLLFTSATAIGNAIWATAVIQYGDQQIDSNGYLVKFKHIDQKPLLLDKTSSRYNVLVSNPYTPEVWLLTEHNNGATMLYPNKQQFSNISLEDINPNNIAFQQDGSMTVFTHASDKTTWGKIAIWNPNNKSFKVHRTNSLEPLSIEAITYDQNGDLYAGTGYHHSSSYEIKPLRGEAKGIYKLDMDNYWQPVSTGHSNPWVQALAGHPEKGLWIGTNGSSAYWSVPLRKKNTAVSTENIVEKEGVDTKVTASEVVEPLIEGGFEKAEPAGAYFMVSQKGKVGLWSNTLNDWALPPKYNQAQQSEHFIRLTKKETHYYQSKWNSEIQLFDQVVELGNTNLYKVQGKKGAWGLIEMSNNNASYLLPVTYDEISPLKAEGHSDYLVIKQKGAEGIYSLEQEKIVVPVAYSEVNESEEPGVFYVSQGKFWGAINTHTPNSKVPAEWDKVELLGNWETSKNHSYWLFKVQSGESWGVFNATTQKLAVDCQYNGIEGRMLSQGLIITRQGNKLGLLEIDGFTELLSPNMQRIQPFDATRLLVKQRGKLGLLDYKRDKKWKALPSILSEMEEAWSMSNGIVLQGESSVRVSNGHLWIPSPLRRRIIRYNVQTGKEVGSIRVPKLNKQGQFLLEGDKAYFTDGHSTLYAYEADGNMLWSHKSPHKIIGTPLIGYFGGPAEKQLVIVTTAGLTAVDLTDGKSAWSHNVAIPEVIESTPIIVRLSGEKKEGVMIPYIHREEGDESCGQQSMLGIYREDGLYTGQGESLLGCNARVKGIFGASTIDQQQQTIVHTSDGIAKIGEAGQVVYAQHGMHQLTDLVQGVFLGYEPQSHAIYGLQESYNGMSFPHITVARSAESLFGGENQAHTNATSPTAVEKFFYHIGKIKAPLFIADILGSGKPQIGFVSENNGILLLLEEGMAKKVYRLPSGSHAMPWVGDADGDGKLEIIISDNIGRVTMYRSNSAGKVYWGEWQGDANNSGILQSK